MYNILGLFFMLWMPDIDYMETLLAEQNKVNYSSLSYTTSNTSMDLASRVLLKIHIFWHVSVSPYLKLNPLQDFNLGFYLVNQTSRERMPPFHEGQNKCMYYNKCMYFYSSLIQIRQISHRFVEAKPAFKE